MVVVAVSYPTKYGRKYVKVEVMRHEGLCAVRSCAPSGELISRQCFAQTCLKVSAVKPLYISH